MVRTKLVTLTLSPMCDQQRGRGRLMGAGSPFWFWCFCERQAAESQVAWKHVCVCVWQEMESSSASLILFNFKDKHQITSLNKCTVSFWPYMLHIKCHYAITDAIFSRDAPFQCLFLISLLHIFRTFPQMHHTYFKGCVSLYFLGIIRCG